MTLDFDPVVAAALQRIAPPVGADADELLRRALATLPEQRRRRSHHMKRATILALAILAILAGAAFAARELDLLPWLKTGSNSTVRFSIDPHHYFRGPVPQAVRCLDAGRQPRFTCTKTSYPNVPLEQVPPRTYTLDQRIRSRPTLTRSFFLHGVERAQAQGKIEKSLARRLLRDARLVSDRFFAFLNTISTIQTFSVGPDVEDIPGQPSRIRVPPAGVPVYATCTERTGAALRCRNLGQSENVPIGAPVYTLVDGRDWRTVRQQPQQQREPSVLSRRFIREFLGRDLTKTEIRFFIEFATAEANAGSTHAHAAHARTIHPR